ncbi:MAG: amidohydrolase, partial [Gammaproteobacteria bacterium]|nr:amidohydrolase [Gammaproteobacteria bacterium]
MKIEKLFSLVFIIGMSTFIPSAAADEKTSANEGEVLFNDAHFHLTNYIQEGLTMEAFLEIMGDKVGRSTVFGIPLQQKWDYFVSGERKPDYYLLSDARLYYYSFV